MANAKGTTVIVTLEQAFAMPDTKTAEFMKRLILQHGTGLGSDDYSIWEWDPEEKVLTVEVV